MRRVPPGDSWHPATDGLAGTETYGPARILTDPKDNDIGTGWSINFERAVPGYNEVLFATGDNKVWLITTKDAIGGAMASPPLFYEDQRRPILKSSKSPSAPHMARWYNRQGCAEDPWISVTDHHEAISAEKIVYGEHSYGGQHAAVLQAHSGANVFIRNSNKKLAEAFKVGDVVLARHVDYGQEEFPGIIIAHLKDVFEVADTDGDGKLTYTEWKNRMGHLLNEDALKKLFDVCDTNKNGTIDRKEFTVGLSSKYEIMWAQPPQTDVIKDVSDLRLSPDPNVYWQHVKQHQFDDDTRAKLDTQFEEPDSSPLEDSSGKLRAIFSLSFLAMVLIFGLPVLQITLSTYLPWGGELKVKDYEISRVQYKSGFADMDLDKNGKLSRDEFKCVLQTVTSQNYYGTSACFLMMDSNYDNQLSLLEYDAGFDKFDLIKDGIITKLEVDALERDLGGLRITSDRSDNCRKEYPVFMYVSGCLQIAAYLLYMIVFICMIVLHNRRDLAFSMTRCAGCLVIATFIINCFMWDYLFKSSKDCGPSLWSFGVFTLVSFFVTCCCSGALGLEPHT